MASAACMECTHAAGDVTPSEVNSGDESELSNIKAQTLDLLPSTPSTRVQPTFYFASIFDVAILLKSPIPHQAILIITKILRPPFRLDSASV